MIGCACTGIYELWHFSYDVCTCQCIQPVINSDSSGHRDIMPLLRIDMIASSDLKLLSHDPSYGERPICWVWWLQALACSKEAQIKQHRVPGMDWGRGVCQTNLGLSLQDALSSLPRGLSARLRAEVRRRYSFSRRELCLCADFSAPVFLSKMLCQRCSPQLRMQCSFIILHAQTITATRSRRLPVVSARSETLL